MLSSSIIDASLFARLLTPSSRFIITSYHHDSHDVDKLILVLLFLFNKNAMDYFFLWDKEKSNHAARLFYDFVEFQVSLQEIDDFKDHVFCKNKRFFVGEYSLCVFN